MDRDTHVIIGIIRDGTRLELKNVAENDMELHISISSRFIYTHL